MTSQPLETIPEEPTPTPTPAPARVTADPPKTKPAKNPGRVASGKRLAERNRLVREAKKKAEVEAASPAPTTTEASASDSTAESSSLSLGAMLGIGSLIVGVVGLYYQREAIMARFKSAPPPPEPAKPAEPAPSRIPVKRGIKKMELVLKHYIYFTMEDFARGIVAGFAVSAAVPAMYYFNKAALGTLFVVNKEIGKALGRVLLPPSPPPVFSFESACNNKKCPIDCICSCDGYHCMCYDCDGKRKTEP